jgi:hypothetical protein
MTVSYTRQSVSSQSCCRVSVLPINFFSPDPLEQEASLVVEKKARYPAAEQAALRDQSLPLLNPAQRAAFNRIMRVVDAKRPDLLSPLFLTSMM